MADPHLHLDANRLPHATQQQRLVYPLRRGLLRLLGPHLNEIDANTKILRGQVEALQGQVEALQGQVEALQGQVEALHALREQVEALEATHWDQTAISRRLAELEDALGAAGETTR